MHDKLIVKLQNLVADTANIALTSDPALVNSWGIAVTDDGMWIADNDSSNLTKYNFKGVKDLSVGVGGNVAVPTLNPTGLVINYTNSFTLPSTSVSAFLLTATENGTIVGYNKLAGTTGIVCATGPSNSVYKGLEILGDTLYVANFHNNTIDTYNSSFVLQTIGFTFADPTIPAGYSPFNIAAIDNLLYVSYALQDSSAMHDDVAGLGHGYVNIFDANGNYVRRFASRGALNSPWAIVESPKSFGLPCDAVLIGNFGDGCINIFDKHGEYHGKLFDKNDLPVQIEGLWGLDYRSEDCSEHIFFASGPNSEGSGLIGSIKPHCL